MPSLLTLLVAFIASISRGSILRHQNEEAALVEAEEN